MKKLLFLFALSFCTIGVLGFEAVAPSGQGLHYDITSSTTVEVGMFNNVSGSLIIPSTVVYNNTTYSVTSIGNSAFNGCDGLTNVTIPNSVATIGEMAFYHCDNLTTVTIPNSVTAIGDGAFHFCSALTSVNYTGTIAEWCGISFSSDWSNPTYYAHTLSFNGTPMGTTLTIPNSVTSIRSYAFANCSGLTTVTIPNSVTYILSSVFYGCSNLSTVTIPNSVTYIGSSAFYGCSNLSTVTIPNSVGTIGDCAFEYCSGLTTLTIGNSVGTIGDFAFGDCRGLTTVTIPNSVTDIGEAAFTGCSGLATITIGNSVTHIGLMAFGACQNLKTVYNLSNLIISKGTSSNGCVAYYAKRVVKCTEHSGSGDNIIYKIPTSYTIIDNDASTSSTEIPYSTIPTNFIYKEGSVWKAKNIVLNDGQDAFEAPETFTAETATYTREFTNSNRSTLYLPFTAAIPEDFEVYDFTSFANNTISFTEHTGDIAAYTPYLVGYDLSKDDNTTTCTITKTNAVFPKSESANYHPVTHDDMTFSGVISRTQMTSTNNYGYSNGFFVQSGGSAHVNPFRCYFTYTPSGNAPQSLPPSLNVEVGYGDPVGIDAVETPDQEYDGRYGKDVYDTLGRLVRKNADNLQGLPRGIYIWKGKKVMNYDF